MVIERISMIFDRIALDRKRKNWEASIRDKKLSSVQVLSDGSLKVYSLENYQIGNRIQCELFVDIYKADDLSARALLEIIGPFKPGDIYFFEELWGGEQWEEIYATDILRPKLEDGSFLKAVLLEDGSIDLYRISQIEETPQVLNFKGKEHVAVILEATGPLKVGEVFEFKPFFD